jgi:hypothetical protein
MRRSVLPPSGSCFPGFLEPRRMAEKALTFDFRGELTRHFH